MLQRDAVAERTVPVAEVAADTEALRAWYDSHKEDVSPPEQRSAEVVMCGDWVTARETLDQIERGELRFEDVGEVFRTQMEERDDHRFPLFHSMLFAPTAKVGTLLPRPIYLNEQAALARVHSIESSVPPPLDDPEVHEAAVTGVRAPRAAAAVENHLNELRERYPERAK